MNRFQVDRVTVYGRETYRVIDRHESGLSPYVLARTDTPDNAYFVAALVNAHAARVGVGTNLADMRGAV